VQAKTVGEKILAAIAHSYPLNGREWLTSSSIGITIFGDHLEESGEVLQQADIAMDQAKEAGRNTLRFFAPALRAAVSAKAALDDELRQAIRSKQFVLYYQPQVSRGRIVGAEALIRWNHPQKGILSPYVFIPLAEETGQILELGNWVLEAACEQIAQWSKDDLTAKLSVAVNISAVQFSQPDFELQVLAVLERTGASHTNLKLELTESMLVNNIEEVIAKMCSLRSHGIGFSLDDFGTGYSSLSYLKRLPLDQLKIDRSFVRDILTDTSSGAIAEAIISLGRAMGMPVIAEGVETEQQREFLARLGCHSFQGYLVSPPLPCKDLLTLIAALEKRPLSYAEYENLLANR
jgi:EAL domain-containing protein (putative c-di-GMP-specific phosphodiesterase class I)